jgi:hypothetical protein
MMSNKTKRFVLTLTASLALAFACAWLFGLALRDTYTDGILLFEPAAGQPPRPSDAFHVGLAMGCFFSGLIYGTMTLSAFALMRMQNMRLQHLLYPLGTSSALCLGATVLSLQLAG